MFFFHLFDTLIKYINNTYKLRLTTTKRSQRLREIITLALYIYIYVCIKKSLYVS